MTYPLEFRKKVLKVKEEERLSYKETAERFKINVSKAHPKANAAVRQVFQEKIKRYEQNGQEIVYLDESGFAQDMPRSYGYALQGQRCYGKHDCHARGRINVIGALLQNCLLTVSLFTRSINSDVFFA